MPSGGSASGSSVSLVQPTPKANPLPGSQVDIHDLDTASLAAQTDDRAGAVQQKMSANIVQLVQNTMGTAHGTIDDRVKAVATDVIRLANQVDDLSDRMDTSGATQKKILLQLERLDLSSDARASSSFVFLMVLLM